MITISHGATQNPAQGDSGRGTSAINGKIGLITNGVSIGSYLQFSSSGIFWNPVASGLTAETVTNITSSTLTVTGQGTRIINIEGGAVTSAAALTNAVNYFTSASFNTFNAALTNNANTYLLGNYNELGINNGRITTNRVNGAVMLMNTNAYDPTYHFFNFVAPASATAWGNINMGGGSTDAGLTIGDFYNIAGSGSRYGLIRYLASQNRVGIYAQSAGTLLSMGGGGSDFMEFNAAGTGVTIGAASSHAITIPGTTITGANGLNLNAGMLHIPSTGVVSNYAAASGITTMNTLQGSNVVATSTDLQFRLSPGTSTNIIINGSGTVPMQSNVRVSTLTNTFLTANPTPNIIYTNNASRMILSVSALFPANANAAIWTVDGTKTNYFGRSCQGTAFTNHMVAVIQPLALYGVSQQVGTVTLIPGEWNQSSW